MRNSHLAQISFTAYDKELAAKVPNAMAELFIESDLEARVAMTQKATEWLRERMGELRSKVDTAEKNLQEYRDRERIVDAKGLALSGASRQLEELTKSLVEASAKRAEAEAAYNLVQQISAGKTKNTYDTIPAVLRHPLVQKAKENEGDAERRLGEASKRYGPEHPAHDQGAGGTRCRAGEHPAAGRDAWWRAFRASTKWPAATKRRWSARWGRARRISRG